MKHYDEFKYPTASELPSWNEKMTVHEALGEALVWFEELDDQLSAGISFLVGRGDDVGQIVTAGLSFRAKPDLFGALFRNKRPQSENLERLDALLGACQQIEQKRNEVVHSRWLHDLDGFGMTRTKVTAHRKRGLQRHSEKLTPAQVQTIAHQCGYLAHSVDELLYWEFGGEYGEPSSGAPDGRGTVGERPRVSAGR